MFHSRNQKRKPGNFKELMEAVRNRTDSLCTITNDKKIKNPEERSKLIRMRGYLRDALKNCSRGDPHAREYVKQYIKGMLENELGIEPVNIGDYLPGLKQENTEAIKDIGSQSYYAAEYFAMFYATFTAYSRENVFDRLYEKLPDEVAERTYIGAEDMLSAWYLSGISPGYTVLLEHLTQKIYEELFGYSVADALIFDRSLDGISAGVGGLTDKFAGFTSDMNTRDSGNERCESYETLYVMYRGRTIRISFLRFRDEAVFERTVKRLSRYDASEALSRNNPYLVSSLADNSRVVTMRPPIAASWSFFVRRFTSARTPALEGLISDRGSDEICGLIRRIVAGEQNIVISGNQGGGKTTLLKAIVGCIDPAYTLRVAESNFEMNINNLYPERNVVSLQERGQFSIFDALTAYKKTDSDILILGEVNEPKIAGALVQIVQNGGNMVLSTLHHLTTQKLIDYLRNALISEYGISDPIIAERQAVDAVNFDIHMVRDKNGHHFIERITEVVPTDDTNRTYYCNVIAEYDKAEGCYKRTGELSAAAIERIHRKTGEELRNDA